MDSLAGLLEFAGYLGGAFAVNEIAANGFLAFLLALRLDAPGLFWPYLPVRHIYGAVFI